jgi:hypothetical protein
MKVTSQALSVARATVSYFIHVGGFVGASDLARLSGLPEDTVVSWTLEKGYIRDPYQEPFDLAILPELWADCADESLACAAFHAALQERLKAGDTTASEWVHSCARDLKQYQNEAR